MEENGMEKMTALFQKAEEQGASDIHIVPGTRVMFRIAGELVPVCEHDVEPEEAEELINSVLDDERRKELECAGELSFACSVPDVCRLRVNIFRQQGTYAAVFRRYRFDIPRPGELGLPEKVIAFAERKQGLVLVTGAGGSGKTTTLASIVDRIAESHTKSIIMLERPVEYLHPHRKSVVVQREIGRDSGSYAAALAAALLQDPDVIMVSELPDEETISLALTAAETGHLVFASLCTGDAARAVERIVSVFPAQRQQQVRVQLSGVLTGIVAQQLLPRQDRVGRVAAFEVMLPNPVIRNLILEGKFRQIPAAIQNGANEGMQTMDDAIYDLYMRSLISSETAVSYAVDPEEMQQKVRLY